MPFTVVTIVVMLLVRRVVGDRERRAQIAERERDVAAREAVVEERARIARELHDVIAHHVSMIVVQAGAERRVLGDSNASTREVLETVEQSGRGALTEMRRLLGMLRGDASEPLAPQPGLDDVPILVGQLREAGLPVELQIDGEPARAPGRDRALRLPDRAGGADQRAQARRRRARDGSRPLRLRRRSSSRSPTTAPATPTRASERRARPGRDARASRALRRPAATRATAPRAASSCA